MAKKTQGSSLAALFIIFAIVVAVIGKAREWIDTSPTPPTTEIKRGDAAAGSPLTICSFNIQFLGQSKERDDEALATVLKDFDIVVVQELTAPPYPGKFPDGQPYHPDVQAAHFFDLMRQRGFGCVISEEDTGPGATSHKNSSATEWWTVFYRPERVNIATDLPHGFLASQHTQNPDFERVPYAFPFRANTGTADFVLISVHLKPDAGPAARFRRRHELAGVAAWVHANDLKEKDFIILGDMNIEDARELFEATPPGFLSLNDECRPTNTNVRGPKPYDHVMFQPQYTTEIDRGFDMGVINLADAVRPMWKGPGLFPGDPLNYEHDRFRKYYSDHNPVVFRMNLPDRDDD